MSPISDQMFSPSRVSYGTLVIFVSRSSSSGTYCINGGLFACLRSTVSALLQPSVISTGFLTRDHCIEMIGQWVAAHRMKLNANKTEVLRLRSRLTLLNLLHAGPSLMIGSARLLGVQSTAHDEDLSLDQQVSAVSASCFYRLRRLRCARPTLSRRQIWTHARSCVPGENDYISPVIVVDKLHRVLNAAARIVTGTRKYDRGTSQVLQQSTSLA
jgi:hypothetical protein